MLSFNSQSRARVPPVIGSVYTFRVGNFIKDAWTKRCRQRRLPSLEVWVVRPADSRRLPSADILARKAGCVRFASVLWTLTWVEKQSRWAASVFVSRSIAVQVRNSRSLRSASHPLQVWEAPVGMTIPPGGPLLCFLRRCGESRIVLLSYHILILAALHAAVGRVQDLLIAAAFLAGNRELGFAFDGGGEGIHLPRVGKLV